MSKKLKKRIIKCFQLEGLTLSKKALLGVLSVLKSENDEEEAIRVMVKSLKARIDRDESRSSVIDVESISQVVADLSKDSEDMAKDGLQVFDAFDFPRLMWNTARKEFFLRPSRGRLHENAKEKNQFLRDRFMLVRQRLMRNELFMAPAPGGIQRNFVELTAIESLRGSSGRKYLLGMLSELEEGSYSIEDLNAHIELDLSECKYHAGLFTLGSIILVEGEIVDDRFRVSTMAFPPPEKREDTLRHMSNVKYLELAPGSQDYIHMRALEERAEDTMFVVLSNVHLDKPRVMEKLEQMFDVFSESEVVPTAFVVTGNFMSRPFGHSNEDTKILTEHFDHLANMISKYSKIRKGSQFIFVPGPSDPSTGHANVLPRPAIPSIFTARLRQVLQNNVVFASNPCRIRFFTQEIVILRENVLHKMQRSSILKRKSSSSSTSSKKRQENNEDDQESSKMDIEEEEEQQQEEEKVDITDHLLKTVCDQSHLCPLPLETRPVYWAHDHAMWLYPLPDLILFADNFDQWSRCYDDCMAANPGIFSTDFSFIVYRPTTKDVEFSRVDF
jgi:DNA polymerase epsilon subunit 2